MCGGEHALLYISPDTNSEFLESILYQPNTEVPDSYYDEEDIYGEDLQQNTITSFCDFCNEQIRR